MDLSLINLTNFIKDFFKGKDYDINWIGQIGFISKNDWIIKIAYINQALAPNGFNVVLYNKINGSTVNYLFFFCEFLKFPENTKSSNPQWSGSKINWEIEPINKEEMINKIFEYIDLYV